MKTLILGGVKSGKSQLAVDMAERAASTARSRTAKNTSENTSINADEKGPIDDSSVVNTRPAVTLIATATAHDEEMCHRIEKHRSVRPAGWHTIEEPIALGQALRQLHHSGCCVVVDCLTLWLTNLLMLQDEGAFEQEMNSLIHAVEEFPEHLILVSNETSMGIIPMGELSRRYCDEAGLLHQALATRLETVVLTVAGLPHILKGHLP